MKSVRVVLVGFATAVLAGGVYIAVAVIVANIRMQQQLREIERQGQGGGVGAVQVGDSATLLLALLGGFAVGCWWKWRRLRCREGGTLSAESVDGP